MRKDILLGTLGGGLAGCLLGVGGVHIWNRFQRRKPIEETVLEAKEIEQKKAALKEIDERVQAVVNDLYSDMDDDSVVKVSPDAAVKWAKKNNTSIGELRYFPEDEVIGGWDEDDFGNKSFQVMDEDAIFEAFMEERRLTPSVTNAWYIHDGECWHVQVVTEEDFATFFDAENARLAPPYPVE